MKTRYKISCAVAAILSGYGGGAIAADPPASANGVSAGVPEIVITATRRNESVQKVPMTVQAFSGETLSKLNVTTLNDILRYTPNVTYGSNGPGQGSVFMRGLSAGQAGNQSSATVGNFPNVAIYLDDQSMQFPGRNVDVYMADIDRVEVLEGPQGTLFGGGAEAGALRYITNKPKLGAFEGKVEASYGFTAHGAENNSETAVLNIPVVKDKLAIRAVTTMTAKAAISTTSRARSRARTRTTTSISASRRPRAIVPTGGRPARRASAPRSTPSRPTTWRSRARTRIRSPIRASACPPFWTSMTTGMC